MLRKDVEEANRNGVSIKQDQSREITGIASVNIPRFKKINNAYPMPERIHPWRPRPNRLVGPYNSGNSFTPFEDASNKGVLFSAWLNAADRIFSRSLAPFATKLFAKYSTRPLADFQFASLPWTALLSNGGALSTRSFRAPYRCLYRHFPLH